MKKCAPILFVTFNRPDLAEQVFEAIKKAKPKKLYFASDGPRAGNNHDRECVTKLRNLVLNNVDWDCQLFTYLSQDNVGLPNANLNAIDWFFEHEEKGIILEDDTLPSSDFFNFCTELLDRYELNDKIMHISGFNIFPGLSKSDYYISNFGHIWGWATWKSSWKKLDRNYTSWKSITDEDSLSRIVMDRPFRSSKNGEFNSGLIRWYYSISMHNGKFILPNISLVENIGFRDDGTNFKSSNGNPYAKVSRESFDRELFHPTKLSYCKLYEMKRIKEKSLSIIEFLKFFLVMLKNGRITDWKM